MKYFCRKSIIFEHKLDEITNRPITMGLEEFVLDRAKRVGLKEGREIGLSEGRSVGLSQGLSQGMAIKELEDKTNFTKNLLLQTDFSDEKIANLVGVDINFVQEIKSSLI
jgi:predicted transposase YdaD